MSVFTWEYLSTLVGGILFRWFSLINAFCQFFCELWSAICQFAAIQCFVRAWIISVLGFYGRHCSGFAMVAGTSSSPRHTIPHKWRLCEKRKSHHCCQYDSFHALKALIPAEMFSQFMSVNFILHNTNTCCHFRIFTKIFSNICICHHLFVWYF